MRNDYFCDQSGATPKPIDLWEPIVIPKEAIDAEIERPGEFATTCQWPAPLGVRASAQSEVQRSGAGNRCGT